MRDILERLRLSDVDSAQRLLGSRIFGEAADEIERLRRDCAEAYQVIGAAMLGEPCKYTQEDVARALDNLSAAANGELRPHDDLLPWPSQPSAEVG